ncbi:hypothetical protein FJTKL_07841 [Diaporthe vaccinii]|uniref:Secreted protein n=1 Tax=Diaporthe vaccinii TaxID=105482 RepID=A0ABR4FDK3_9PEZI
MAFTTAQEVAALFLTPVLSCLLSNHCIQIRNHNTGNIPVREAQEISIQNQLSPHHTTVTDRQRSTCRPVPGRQVEEICQQPCMPIRWVVCTLQGFWKPLSSSQERD